METWDSKLIKTLSDHGIETSHSYFTNSGFRIKMSIESVSVELELYLKNNEKKYYSSTQKFGIIYLGTETLDDNQKRLVTLFTNLLSSIERKINGLPVFLKGSSTYIGKESNDNFSLNRQINNKFFFCTVEESLSSHDNEKHYEAMVRLTQDCNQSCPFCSGEKLARKPEKREIFECINYLNDTLENLMITITGGEPTLNSCFYDCIEYICTIEKIESIQIQSNAVHFASKEFIQRMPKNDKISFFISLHSTNEQVYNKCTGTEGQFKRAITGITNILKAGFPVLLNCVISSINNKYVEEYINDTTELFGHLNNKPELHFSSLICSRFNSLARNYLIKYSTLAQIYKKISESNSVLEISSFLSSTHASIPPCFLESDIRKDFYFNIENDDTSYEDLTSRWVKAYKCKSCKFDNNCLGLPNEYVQMFGLGELNPI